MLLYGILKGELKFHVSIHSALVNLKNCLLFGCTISRPLLYTISRVATGDRKEEAIWRRRFIKYFLNALIIMSCSGPKEPAPSAAKSHGKLYIMHASMFVMYYIR